MASLSRCLRTGAQSAATRGPRHPFDTQDVRGLGATVGAGKDTHEFAGPDVPRALGETHRFGDHFLVRAALPHEHWRGAPAEGQLLNGGLVEGEPEDVRLGSESGHRSHREA